MKHGTIIPLIGGMALGATKALGEDPSWAVSWDGFATNEQNFKNYFKGVPFRTLDNDNLDSIGLNDDIFKNTMIVSAVPPCAGLSRLNPTISNKTANAEHDYKSNMWMYLTSSLVLRDIKPKVMIFENAPGLMQNFGSWVREQAISIGQKYGYSISFVFTTSSLHGLPQNRKRSFVFFWDSEFAPNFKWFNKPHLSPKEILQEQYNSYKDTPEHQKCILKDIFTETNYYKYCSQKFGKEWRTEMLAKYKELPKSVSIEYFLFQMNLQDDFIEFLKNEDPIKNEKHIKHIEYAKYKMSLGKGWWNASSHFYRDGIPFNAITMRAPNMLHPTEDRYLSVREHMIFMGLQNDFNLQNDYYNAVFQNVPVNTAHDWVSFCKDFVEGNTTPSESKVLYGDNIKQKQWT
jgi:site-specific DNA-cytosine methylase